MKKIISVILSVLILSLAAMNCFAAEFDDVSADHWAHAAINEMSDREYIKGYNGFFRPADFITRGEMAVIIDRIAETQGISENTFSDLPADAYYTEAILRLNWAELMLGYDGKIRPNDYITREEAFVIINRVFQFEKTMETAFPDSASISDWALESVYALAEKKVINGYEDGCIYPKKNITRAEVVQLLDKSYAEIERLTESDGVIGGDDLETGGIW